MNENETAHKQRTVGQFWGESKSKREEKGRREEGRGVKQHLTRTALASPH